MSESLPGRLGSFALASLSPAWRAVLDLGVVVTGLASDCFSAQASVWRRPMMRKVKCPPT